MDAICGACNQRTPDWKKCGRCGKTEPEVLCSVVEAQAMRIFVCRDCTEAFSAWKSNKPVLPTAGAVIKIEALPGTFKWWESLNKLLGLKSGEGHKVLGQIKELLDERGELRSKVAKIAERFPRRKPPFRVKIGQQRGNFLCVYYVIDADDMLLCEAGVQETAVQIARLCNVACEVENPEPEIAKMQGHDLEGSL